MDLEKDKFKKRKVLKELTDEDIEKALNELDVLDEEEKTEEEDDVENEDVLDDDEEEEDVEAEEEDVEKAKKKELEDDENDEDVDIEDIEEENSYTADDEDDDEEKTVKFGKKKRFTKSKNSKIEKNLKSRNREVTKAVEVSPFLRGFVEDFDAKTNDIIQENRKINVRLIKALTNITERLDRIEEDLGKPRPRKSLVDIKHKERVFSKANDDDFNNKKERILNVRTGKPLILKALDSLSFNENGFNEEAALAMKKFETTGILNKTFISDIEKALDCKLEF